MNKQESQSYWIATTPQSHFPKLSQDLSVDVIVIGAGITGLTSALLLKRQGKKVVVIDHSTLGYGDSGHTTAHLTEVIDTRYHTLISDFGEVKAKQVAESSRAAIERIGQFVQELSIDCDFRRVPAYLYTERKDHLQDLKKELNAVQKLGIKAVWEEKVPLPFPTHGGIRFENQAQFHIGHYLRALAKAISGEGCFIFEQTRALEIKDGKPCQVVTENGVLTAPDVIVATHSPSSNKVTLHTKIAAYRTYVQAVRLRGSQPPPGLYWDTEDPYHYTRSQDDLWIIGGEDHKTGHKTDTDESFHQLNRYIGSHFDIKETAYQWSGQVLESVDGLPFMGLSPMSQHLYVATGFSGNGMTFGTVAGMLLSDLVLDRQNERKHERQNEWEDLYKATRIKPLASIKDYITENVDFPVCFIKERVSPLEATSLLEIKPGEGKRMRIGKQPVAVYRDESGKVHSVQAVCPHMGCYVHFNSAEKSWDCPCHGARFNTEGKLLNGPAKRDLEKVALPDGMLKSEEGFQKIPGKVALKSNKTLVRKQKRNQL